jgi:hypothetical protein
VGITSGPGNRQSPDREPERTAGRGEIERGPVKGPAGRVVMKIISSVRPSLLDISNVLPVTCICTL